MNPPPGPTVQAKAKANGKSKSGLAVASLVLTAGAAGCLGAIDAVHHSALHSNTTDGPGGLLEVIVDFPIAIFFVLLAVAAPCVAIAALIARPSLVSIAAAICSAAPGLYALSFFVK